ncbi:vacuolar sorting protein 35 [Babesia gibsoni]|uniref:Vacuolar protein sorting-associated protein 35 n=1 Tax=Babesia gibsoni TaxID=33632 RepID=A0AAD8LIM4_BABGI|nr:vacuolar sorting protein 35 [Babesia gibsoni]
MRRNGVDPEHEDLQSEGGGGTIDQCKLLEEALFYVKEHSYYMHQALEAEDLGEALKRAINIVSELRTSSLTPTHYYELYMKVFNELQMLSDFIGNDKKRGMSLVKLYENVQQCCFILPRMYLLIMAGSHRIRANSSLSNEILKDITELCRGIQHPVRGLFLRYFLVQMCKDSFPDVVLKNREGTIQSFEFLLLNFKESVRLWVRMNSGSVNLIDQRRKNKERTELGLLVGSNLVRMAQLDGLDAEFYTELALPRILEVVGEVKDMLAKKYVLDCLIQAFSDEYHLKSLQVLLKTISASILSDDCIKVLTNLMKRLSQYFVISDDTTPDAVPGDLFEIFQEHLNEIDLQKGISMKAFLELHTSFLEFTSTVYPGIIEHIEEIIKNVRTCVNKYMEDEGEIGDDTLDSFIMLHTIPLQTLGLRSLKIFENSWMKEFMPKHKHADFSRAIVDAMVQYKVYIHDADDLQTVFEFDCPFFAGAHGQEFASPEEERYVSRFIHMIRANDVFEQFSLYQALFDRMTSNKPFRHHKAVQTLMMASLKLIYRLFDSTGETTPSSKVTSFEETKAHIMDILKFFSDMAHLIELVHPQDAFKLLSLAAVTVNELSNMLKLDSKDSSDYDEFGAVCYDFIARACIIFEELLFQSNQQLCCLRYMLSLFCSKVTMLSDGQYREMANRLSKYPLGLLKLEHKLSGLAHIGVCFSNNRDTDRVRWVLEKALRVAESYRFESYANLVTYMKPVLALSGQYGGSPDLAEPIDAIDRYLQNASAYYTSA